MTDWENEPGPAPPAPAVPRTRVDVAGDLHDHVIQELFTLGLRIQGDAARSESAVAAQINGYAETLDEVIAKIRTSIFGLHPAGPERLGTGECRRCGEAERAVPRSNLSSGKQSVRDPPGGMSTDGR